MILPDGHGLNGGPMNVVEPIVMNDSSGSDTRSRRTVLFCQLLPERPQRRDRRDARTGDKQSSVADKLL